jgi:hypothetical protein
MVPIRGARVTAEIKTILLFGNKYGKVCNYFCLQQM